MATAAIQSMFAVCGMVNVGAAAANPAAQFVVTMGMRCSYRRAQAFALVPADERFGST
jgi:hypothetical protein